MPALPGEKRYVTVMAIHYPDGECVPIVIEAGGRAYTVQRVFENKPAPKGLLESATEYFAVEVNGVERFLFREGRKWFMIAGLVRKSEQNNRA